MTKTIIKSELVLPFVRDFGDYHDIDFLKDDYKSFGFKGVKAKEIAFDGAYWGLFYTGKLPKKAEVKELLSEALFDFENGRFEY